MSDFLSSLSLKQKIALGSGRNMYESKTFKKHPLPILVTSDGPCGIRKQDVSQASNVNVSYPSTAFPFSSALACSFDPELAFLQGQALGEEAKHFHVSMVLGPAMNLIRNPRGGRSFEYFSEDPLLAGKIAASYTRGIQSTGVGACVKHFCVNSQENYRFVMDAEVDERALHELYLKPFEIVVKEAKPQGIMSSYNQVNGVFSSDNKTLLRDTLRNEWGFDGIAMSDWGGLNDRVKAYEAGLDLAMPGNSAYGEKAVLKAVQEGTLDEKVIDESVTRLLSFTSKTQNILKESYSCDFDTHHQIAVTTECESAVLLKNDGVLPLADYQDVAVIGRLAKEPHYQGGGSSHLNPKHLVSFLSLHPELPYAEGYLGNGSTSQERIQKALEITKEKKTVLFFAGLADDAESEGFDRDSLSLPEGEKQVLDALCHAGKDVVVLLMTGSPVLLPFRDQVSAILSLGLGGEGVGEAVDRLLLGKANPCGKTACTWPFGEDSLSEATFGKKFVPYLESVYVGYRDYDKRQKDVAYPFGYGLSYSFFAYRNIRKENDTIVVEVENTSNVPGKEVVELYVENPQNPGEVYRPLRNLVGFQKVCFGPNERKEVRFKIEDSFFSIWHDGRFQVVSGGYVYCVGPSSRNLPLRLEEHIDGVAIQDNAPKVYHTLDHVPSVEDFEALTGRKISEPKPHQKGTYTMNDCLLDVAKHSWLGRIVKKGAEQAIWKTYRNAPGGKENAGYKMAIASSIGASLRVMKECGNLRMHVMEAILLQANGHPIHGFFELWRVDKNVK